jgi:hypothetical protein
MFFAASTRVMEPDPKAQSLKLGSSRIQAGAALAGSPRHSLSCWLNR